MEIKITGLLWLLLFIRSIIQTDQKSNYLITPIHKTFNARHFYIFILNSFICTCISLFQIRIRNITKNWFIFKFYLIEERISPWNVLLYKLNSFNFVIFKNIEIEIKKTKTRQVDMLHVSNYRVLMTASLSSIITYPNDQKNAQNKTRFVWKKNSF